MGLIVIVIMLTVGMFIVISSKIHKPVDNMKQEFDDDQLGSKYLITFLKTSSGCRDYTMEDLIQDCAISRLITCKGLSSCNYVNQTAGHIINNTLGLWNKKYNFTIENLPTDIQFEDECGPNSQKLHSWQPISLYPFPGTATIKLDICE